jgi:hypothetical protein
MYAFKWACPHTRMFFAPDDGSGATSPTPEAGAGGDAGGSSVAAPSDGGAAPTVAPSTDDVSPWANLGEDLNEDTIEVPAAPVAPAPPTPAPAVVPPVVPHAVAPTPATPAATPAAATPAQTPTDPASSPSSEAAPPLSPSDPFGVAVALEQNRDAAIAHLAQTRFALTDTDIAELESDAAKAVPKLLARAMLETQTTMYRFLAQAVPGMIQKHSTVSKANEDAETKFFEAHKALGLKFDNNDHRKTATRLASLYRQANPGISLDQLISDVGPMVAMTLKLAPVAPGTAPAPTAPKAPAFRPAVDGGGGGFTPAPAAPNEWMQLGADHEE